MQRQYLILMVMLIAVSGCVSAPPTGPAASAQTDWLSKAPPALAQQVRANPTSSEAWFQLGNNFADNNQLVEAERAYQQALMQGTHVKAQHNLGLVHIRLGIMALRSASEQLPANHPTRLETKRFLQYMSKAGY